MIKFYESQEERNEIQKEILEAYAEHKVKYEEGQYTTIFVDKDTDIIKSYVVTPVPLEGVTPNDENLITVHLGQVSPEILELIQRADQEQLSTFPIYDIDSEMLSFIEMNVKGVNCTYDENSGKWQTKDGSDTYKFHVLVTEEDGDKSTAIKSIYIKQQETNRDTIKLNGQSTTRINIDNYGTFEVQNLKGSEQTIRVKAPLIGEDKIWLVKYITIA